MAAVGGGRRNHHRRVVLKVTRRGSGDAREPRVWHPTYRGGADRRQTFRSVGDELTRTTVVHTRISDETRF